MALYPDFKVFVYFIVIFLRDKTVFLRIQNKPTHRFNLRNLPTFLTINCCMLTETTCLESTYKSALLPFPLDYGHKMSRPYRVFSTEWTNTIAFDKILMYLTSWDVTSLWCGRES